MEQVITTITPMDMDTILTIILGLEGMDTTHTIILDLEDMDTTHTTIMGLEDMGIMEPITAVDISEDIPEVILITPAQC